MEKQNSKFVTLSFAVAALLSGLMVSLLIKAFSGAFAFVARAASSDLFRHGVPLLVGLVVFAALQFNPKVRKWAEEVIIELRKVVFPSRKDTVAMTIVVIVMVILSSAIISVFDLTSGYIIKSLMR